MADYVMCYYVMGDYVMCDYVMCDYVMDIDWRAAIVGAGLRLQHCKVQAGYEVKSVR